VDDLDLKNLPAPPQVPDIYIPEQFTLEEQKQQLIALLRQMEAQIVEATTMHYANRTPFDPGPMIQGVKRVRAVMRERFPDKER
jgi:hypothetical protein